MARSALVSLFLSLLTAGCGAGEARRQLAEEERATAPDGETEEGGQSRTGLELNVENREIPEGPEDAEYQSCASSRTEAQLEEIHLVFLLDDSASMGNIDEEKANQRWVPVTNAMKAFFADPGSTGLYASMILFPLNNNLARGGH